MDKEQLILEQYRIYTDTKERYIDRSFSINKFYLISVGIFFILMFSLKYFVPSAFSIFAGLEFFGIMLCVMWFSNQDAYSVLIKIKYSAVLEKIEEKLPVAPVTDEYAELQTKRKNKKLILFKDIQKWFAIIFMLIFTANFLLDITNYFLATFLNT